MKVTAEATPNVTVIDGVMGRVWKARTEDGVEFFMFVHRCMVPEGADQAQFQAALTEMPEPVRVDFPRAFDARLFAN